MTVDPRDELWEATFKTYYDAYYIELLEDALIARWQVVDEVTKVLVALTAGGSAVSGWALWTQPHFKTIWAILAGIAALLAIVHSALAVPGRISDHAEAKRRFASLRIGLETFCYRMRVAPEFPVPEFMEELAQHRRVFSDAVQLCWMKHH